jgi:hypothetical protein
MNTEEIKRLLEKYYNAESTEEEELKLRKFFSQEDVPEDFREVKEIFRYYLQVSDIPEPSANFEKKIISAINAEYPGTEKAKSRRLFFLLTGIAAGLLILTGSYFFFLFKAEPRDTFSDPDIAYAEAMKILYDVSSRLNHGTQALEPILKMQDFTKKSFNNINKSTSIIEEKLKSLDHFRKAMEIININNKSQTNNN